MLANNHPLRAALSDEMHARKLTRLPSPARVFQFVLVVTGEEASKNESRLHGQLEGMPAQVQAGGRYLTCEMDDFLFAWEQHSEFMTYTFVVRTPAKRYSTYQRCPRSRRI